MATIKDVSKLANVSTATVSHVMNNTRHVSLETKKKVNDAMKKLGYIPNNAARVLRSNNSMTVGVIVPDISNSYFAAVLESAEKILSKQGYQIVIGNTREKIENEIEQINMFRRNAVDGILIASCAKKIEEIKDHLFENIPIVFFDRLPKGYDGDFVLSKNVEGAKLATKHLIDCGCKKIAMISGVSGISTTNERIEGFIEAYANEEYIVRGDSTLQSGIKLTKELLKSNANIDGIFVSNNQMTIGSLIALKELGIKVPKEVSIVGYDDYPWASVTYRALTCVSQKVGMIGRKSAGILVSKMKNKNTNEKYQLRLNTELIIRDTTKMKLDS